MKQFVFTKERLSLPQSDVVIAISIDDNYVPHAGAMIVSLAENSNQDRQYDIAVLNTIMGCFKKEQLNMVAQKYPNINLHFIDMGSSFQDVYLSRHISKPTYYRLALPEIFFNCDKVLYLDSDIIILDDIAKLYDIDLDGNFIAGVRDILTFDYNCLHHVKFDHGKTIYQYLHKELGYSEELIRDWINAGVTLWNIKKMREERVIDVFSKEVKKDYMFHDQDIINMLFVNSRKHIDSRWNVFNNVCGNESNHMIFYRDYLKGRENPGLIHFFHKPWLCMNDMFGKHEYLSCLAETPWHDLVMLKMRLGAFDREINVLRDKLNSLESIKRSISMFKRVPMVKPMYHLINKLSKNDS